MPKTRKNWIRRAVNLAESDYWTIKQAAYDRDLGQRGFSAALRLIIREWLTLTERYGAHLQEPPLTEISPRPQTDKLPRSQHRRYTPASIPPPPKPRKSYLPESYPPDVHPPFP